MAKRIKIEFLSNPTPLVSIGFQVAYNSNSNFVGVTLPTTVAIGATKEITATNLYNWYLSYGFASWQTAIQTITLDSNKIYFDYLVPDEINLSFPVLDSNQSSITIVEVTVAAPSGIGETVNVQVQSNQDAALFLATDFLDLSGINNNNMYRNPQNINYYDPAAPVPGIYSNSCVFICKDTRGGGDTIKSYNTTAGGFTLGNTLLLNPGWEWWERGFLVRDTNVSGKNQNIYNYLITTVQQNSSTCAWYPATNAIKGIGPIVGSCGVTPPIPGGVATVTYLNGSGTLNAFTTLPFAATQSVGLMYTFNVTFTASSSAYQFTAAQLAAITLSSPGGCIITARTTGGTYYSNSNGYSQITLTITDPNFGPAGTETLTFSGADALIRYAVTVRNVVNTAPASTYDGYKLSYGEGPFPPGKVNFDIKNETLSTVYVRLTTDLNGVTTGTGQLNPISPSGSSLFCTGTSPVNYSSGHIAIAAGDTINVDMYQNSGTWFSGSNLAIAAFPNSTTINTVDELLIGQI